ncbi:MAG: Eco29kI family restriction endonuclease [Xanthomonadales bacterium]|nr:Eco29kI family restriction endonuclease [Xanthomonadales bacterium]
MSKSKAPPRIPPFNPLDKRNLGESVAEAMLQQPISALPPEPFIGAGIYAIYYVGDFDLYRDVSIRNTDDRYSWPIYVGKAVPAGTRKGGFGLGSDPKQVLHKRLIEHATSIEQTENLLIADFRCRFLVVDDIWIPLAESLLIETYQPLWNREIEGFGNHDPGSGRHKQQRSSWDTLHPGRPWAAKLQPLLKEKQRIEEAVGEYVLKVAPQIDSGAVE